MWSGTARYGFAGTEWAGVARCGESRTGIAGKAAIGRTGMERQDMAYKFRDGGTQRNGVTAEKTWKRLEAIRKREGDLTPIAIVNDARPEQAVLHPHFTWDDMVAGENWRAFEARNLVRSVVVVEADSSQVKDMMVSVETVDGRGYKPASVAVQTEDDFSSAHRMLMGKLSGIAAALDDLKRIAAGSERSDAMALIAAATEAMATARAAIEKIQ